MTSKGQQPFAHQFVDQNPVHYDAKPGLSEKTGDQALICCQLRVSSGNL